MCYCGTSRQRNGSDRMVWQPAPGHSYSRPPRQTSAPNHGRYESNENHSKEKQRKRTKPLYPL